MRIGYGAMASQDFGQAMALVAKLLEAR